MLKELVEKQDRVIKVYGDDDSSFSVFATVWFNEEGLAVIAEPYSDYGSGRVYHNREIDFDLID